MESTAKTLTSQPQILQWNSKKEPLPGSPEATIKKYPVLTSRLESPEICPEKISLFRLHSDTIDDKEFSKISFKLQSNCVASLDLTGNHLSVKNVRVISRS